MTHDSSRSFCRSKKQNISAGFSTPETPHSTTLSPKRHTNPHHSQPWPIQVVRAEEEEGGVIVIARQGPSESESKSESEYEVLGSVYISISLFLYTVDILFYVEWCIRLLALIFFYHNL